MIEDQKRWQAYILQFFITHEHVERSIAGHIINTLDKFFLEINLAKMREAELVLSNIRTHRPAGGRQLARSSTGIMDLWKNQSIYRAPAHMKDLIPKAYTPQLVSIGPYHFGEPHLLAMDEHKARALQRFLDRTKKDFTAYCSALSPLTDDLMESYQQLGEEWKGDRDRFLQLMVFDGSFLYEYMRGVSEGWDGYDEQDPIFSKHALPNICPYVLPDILMLENQLPLLVIERLIAVETDQLSQQNDAHAHTLVFNFLLCTEPFPNMTPGKGLHLLDVSRKVMAKGFLPTSETDHIPAIAVKSAKELLSAGVQFNVIESDNRDISFDRGTLSLPRLKFESITEPYFLNAIAFECLHPTARREVSSYVAFMKGLISSAEDVTALTSLGVIESEIGDSHVVVSLVKEMSKNVFFDPSSNLCKVRDSINEYHRIKMKKWKRRFRGWWRSLRENHLKNPWTITALVTAFVLLVLTLIQTIYSAMSYYHR